GMRNILIVPLMAGKQHTNGREGMSRTLADISDCIGFAFINYTPNIQPSRGHYAFAQDIAAQCALAIEKAHLLNEVRQREKEANERANTLDAIFQAMTEGITVLNQEGEVLVRNRSASRFLNTPMNAPMKLAEFIERYPLYTLQGELMTEQEFPLARALKGERIRGERIIISHANGGQRVLEVNATPLLNHQRQQIGIVSASRDITEQIEIDEHIRLALAAVLQLMEAVCTITDTTEIMRNVLTMAMNTLNCDRGLVQLYDQETHHFTPLLSMGYASEADAQWLVQQCIWNVARETASYDFHKNILAGNTTIVEADKYPNQPEHLKHLRVLAAPITHNDRLLGLMMIDHSPYLQLDIQRQEFSMWDIAIAEGIAQMAGLAIEQARWQQEAADARIREANMQEESVLKDEFLAITAHEFNSPLAIILMQSQMTLRKLRKAPEKVSESDIIKAFVNIEAQGQHLTNIVKTYLDVPKIKSGQLTLTVETVDLAEIAQQAVENISTIAKTHQFYCHIAPAEQPYLVQGDSAGLTQVIANLLQNAVKYSPDGGPITVSLRQCLCEQNKRIQVCVEDKGLGIPLDAQQHLFERFYRASNINKKKTVGIGLGLYIVAELLHLQGGTIAVESSGVEGEGSRFTFTLPLLESEVVQA
ncbi:MAG: PAS domain-containing sensor histidine kinase, partial [Chloroflexota bacterium]|nr:PAS domain-containing sensor histidine kinase [Chloroflexota bacterium]